MTNQTLLGRLPVVVYNGIKTSNLLAKIVVVKAIMQKYTVYYPYTIHDGERPDSIAHDYYGDSDYAWLVLLANDIIDPYYNWPMSDIQFHEYLYKRYGAVYELRSEICHYKYTGIGGQSQEEIDRTNWKMSVETFDSMGAEEKSGWVPVYLYDYEYQLNQDRRQIKLISNRYLSQIQQEVTTLLEQR